MKALIVDDEQPARSTIRLLADWTLYDIDEVLEAETVEQAITCLRRSRPQIIITDIRMPQHDGLELMQWLHQNQPQAQVIVISAYNEFEYAISAMHPACTAGRRSAPRRGKAAHSGSAEAG